MSLSSGLFCDLQMFACASMSELFKAQQDAGVCFQVQNTSQVAVAAPEQSLSGQSSGQCKGECKL